MRLPALSPEAYERLCVSVTGRLAVGPIDGHARSVASNGGGPGSETRIRCGNGLLLIGSIDSFFLLFRPMAFVPCLPRNLRSAPRWPAIAHETAILLANPSPRAGGRQVFSVGGDPVRAITAPVPLAPKPHSIVFRLSGPVASPHRRRCPRSARSTAHSMPSRSWRRSMPGSSTRCPKYRPRP